MEKNLKLVCPKCGEYHNPNSIHSMDVSDFVEGDIRTIMEERGWCFQCACWQNIYNVHKDDPGWIRIDGVSWILKPMVENVPRGWNGLGTWRKKDVYQYRRERHCCIK